MTQGPSTVESSRALLYGSAALFTVSCLFPVGASVLQPDQLPRWVGIADVIVAAAVISLGLFVVSRKSAEFAFAVVATAFRSYRGLSNIFLALLVLFFLAGEHVRWNILLPGLAWRAWLLVLVLPSWLSLWHMNERRE